MTQRKDLLALRSLLDAIDSDVLTSSVPDDVVDDALRAEGGDPDAIAERGHRLAENLLALRRPVGHAVSSYAAIHSAKVAQSARWKLLRERVDSGRSDPRFAAVLDQRDSSLDDATEDDLWLLVDHLERLKTEKIPE
ncbi:MAG: hypothetical protein QM831_12645 [Kofleriaceae bacterium]